MQSIRSIGHSVLITTTFCWFLSTSLSRAEKSQPLSPGTSQTGTSVLEQCDQLADPIPLVDPTTRGRGVDFDKINVRYALPVCEEAAHLSSDPHYLALYALVLRAAGRYPDAIKASKKAAARG